MSQRNGNPEVEKICKIVEQQVRDHFDQSTRSFDDGSYDGDDISLPEHPDIDDYTNAYIANQELMDKLLVNCSANLRAEVLRELNNKYSATRQAWLIKGHFVNPFAMKPRRGRLKR